MERRNTVTQTLRRRMNSLSRRRAVNTHSPTEPRGHSAGVLSFLRRTVKRNYLGWSLCADSFILGQAHFCVQLRKVAPFQENTNGGGKREKPSIQLAARLSNTTTKIKKIKLRRERGQKLDLKKKKKKER